MLHNQKSRRVAVIGGVRTPFCRSHTAYKKCTNKDLMTAALKGLVEKFELRNEALGEVALGALIKHSNDWNLARESVIECGLSMRTPAFDLQRACGTSLEAAILIANKISLGQIDSGIAGGTDSISDTPVVYPEEYRHLLMDIHRARTPVDRIKSFLKIRPKHFKPQFPGVTEPRTGLSMGESTELMAKTWNISRKKQDQLSFDSHYKAAAAYNEGWFNDLVVPFNGVEEDNNIRSDTTLDKLSTLKPVFDKSNNGTMTAGNSTPLTDGAAAVLLASEEWAKEKNLPILAYLTFAQASAVNFVDDEGLLMAPAYAVSDMLKKANLKLQDFDFYEIHEAFAAQTLATLESWKSEDFCRNKLERSEPMGSINFDKLNTKGGSIAIGHPFAATGARIVATMAKLLNEKGSGRGLISVCTAGGMGVTAIMETEK